VTLPLQQSPSDVYSADPAKLHDEVIYNNWWVSGGHELPDSYPISLKKQLTFLNGQSVEVEAMGSISVYRPNSTITTSAGTVAVDDKWRNPATGQREVALHFGVRPALQLSDPPGILFTASFTTPGGCHGELRWVQVINHHLCRYRPNNSSFEVFKWEEDGPSLDRVYPFPQLGAYSTEDSPAVGIDFKNGEYQINYIYNATSFTMYLEFKPNGSSGMWVPLRKVSWHWAGSAVLTSGTWALESWSTQSVTLNEETEDYPLWHKVIGPINFVLDEQ
jgi:hypothetical protein